MSDKEESMDLNSILNQHVRHGHFNLYSSKKVKFHTIDNIQFNQLFQNGFSANAQDDLFHLSMEIKGHQIEIVKIGDNYNLVIDGDEYNVDDRKFNLLPFCIDKQPISTYNEWYQLKLNYSSPFLSNATYKHVLIKNENFPQNLSIDDLWVSVK